jgi:hypothetical protein
MVASATQKDVFRSVAVKEDKAFEEFFAGWHKTSGHSAHTRSCKNFEGGYEIPQERDVIHFLQQYEIMSIFDLTKDPCQSIATGKWRELHQSTPILQALHRLTTRRPEMFGPKIKLEE